jgi:hypothetical protein
VFLKEATEVIIWEIYSIFNISMKTKTKGFRLFYYFRIGYGTYLAMFIGVANVLTTTYFLAGKKIPWVQQVFPNFESYIAFCIAIGVPIVVIVGWLHFKRMGTYTQEVAISYQYSPYNYKFQPGYNREVFAPAYLAILQLNIKRMKGEKLSHEELENILSLETKLKALMEGGFVGSPPKGVLE